MSSGTGRRAAAILAWLVVGLSIGISQGAAQVLPPQPPADVVAAKAYGLLERSCARCHQAGALEGRRAGGGIANILALDEVARDPALVRPGLPDASRLYTVALTRELHLDVLNDPAVPAPTAADLQPLRDWIGELGTQAGAEGCTRPPFDHASLREAIDRALGKLTPERARQTRLVSLAHLSAACVGEAELEAFRQALPTVLAGLAPPGVQLPAPTADAIRPIDADRLLLAVMLTDLGLRAAQWDALVSAYPLAGIAAAATSPTARAATGSAVPIVAADWLAHEISARRGETQTIPADVSPSVWGLSAVEALAHVWRRPADLTRAAADLGITALDLGQRLAGVPPALALPALGLRGGGVARRSDLDRLHAALLTKAQMPSAAENPGAAAPIVLAIASDKPAYRPGEVASFSAVATRDCFLTLVGIDKGGRATVLFPNEIEPDNRIKAGETARVPGPGAAYRFRFNDRGKETIVGICSATHKAPRGVVHDYDRLRFTVLGDWQLFLRDPPDAKEARRDDAASDVPSPQARQRRGRGRGAEAKETSTVDGADVQTRTAIVVRVE